MVARYICFLLSWTSSANPAFTAGSSMLKRAEARSEGLRLAPRIQYHSLAYLKLIFSSSLDLPSLLLAKPGFLNKVDIVAPKH